MNRDELVPHALYTKSRIAPMRALTIPRRKLCAALSLAGLYGESNITRFRPERVIFWSDSSTVLHWLQKEPANLKVFEAHRVNEIQELSKIVDRRYIQTNHNPVGALS